ncbi:toll/interleukin-1 receptor domain-containing protein [Arthrobacter sp. TWP1-1]|uniref:toll/interleukin-1 receptor domain-containing protein n=1 Tax=Arthrobacter sp. TWP1-1 TaxID=2804568 RepID=UPI003CEA2F52
MSEIAAKAFLSYAHADNEREGGRITHLADLIRSEFEFLTGETIEIFVDSAEIQWGQDFRARLDEAMQSTTFFIPVLTPTYFLREECRKEMVQFVSSATSLGLQELLLSIRYAPVLELCEGSSDELKDIAARMQFEPWDDVRLLDEASSQYRTRVNKLATRLVQLTRDLEARPVSLASGVRSIKPGPVDSKIIPGAIISVSDSQPDSGEEDEDAPGFLELMADFQPATEEWIQTLSSFEAAMNDFSGHFSEVSVKMSEANKKPNPFAAKIVLARKLASDVALPLEVMEKMSKEFSTGLLRIDPIIRVVLEKSKVEEDETVKLEAVSGIQGLVVSSREAMASIAGAADSAKANSGMSRDLRPILRRFETALRNVVDGQDIIEGWVPLIDNTP